jgi:hypothetical protein
MFIFPPTGVTQEVLDLPGQDRPLTVTEEEVFSVGAMDGDEWETFSGIDAVFFDADGNLYILDGNNFRVVKVGPQGDLITEMGRAGEGPGEFGMPIGMSVNREGEVRVYDMAHQRFTVFNTDGTFKSNARVAGTSSSFFVPNGGLMSLPNGTMVDGGKSPRKLQVMASGGGSDQLAPRPVNIITIGEDTEISSGFDAWNPLTAVGKQDEKVFSGGGIQMTGNPMRAFDAELFVGAFPDGRIAVADSTTYSIKIVDPGRGVARVLRRPFSPREVTRRDQADEREREFARIAERIGSGSGGRAYSSDGGGSIAISAGNASDLLRTRVESMEFGEEMPVLADMTVDWDGRIWTERTGRRVGEEGPIDLIDADGRYHGSFQAGEFRIPDAFGPGGLVAYIERDEMDVPFVVVKRLSYLTR